METKIKRALKIRAEISSLLVELNESMSNANALFKKYQCSDEGALYSSAIHYATEQELEARHHIAQRLTLIERVYSRWFLGEYPERHRLRRALRRSGLWRLELEKFSIYELRTLNPDANNA